MYMHISTINFDNLKSEELVRWLEERAGDEGFVFVSDGDHSCQRDFDLELMTLEEVMNDISENEIVVFAEDAPLLEGFTKGVSYWGDSMLTKDLE